MVGGTVDIDACLHRMRNYLHQREETRQEGLSSVVPINTVLWTDVVIPDTTIGRTVDTDKIEPVVRGPVSIDTRHHSILD